MNNTPGHQAEVEKVSTFLVRNLGANLCSLILYGSAARGGFIDRKSDLNLLVVLEASTAQAHDILREARVSAPRLEPFVVERAGFVRATQVFGLKFLSIRRHYQVLHGTDLLKDLRISDALHVLLAEQECRNLRMRLTHTYVTADRGLPRYERFLLANAPRFFIVLSDVARCDNVDLPKALEARVEILSKTFGASTAPLSRLWGFHQGRARLTTADIHRLHADLMVLLSAALNWIEQKWPSLPI